MRTTLGFWYRGIWGYFSTFFEKTPPFPAGLVRQVIGHSVEGREIECFTIGSGSQHIALVFAIHGNEVGTVKLSRHVLTWLHEHQNELPRLTCHLVPALNPDGYARALAHPRYMHGGDVGRVNAHEVDLNRNFDTPSFTRESVWAYGKDYACARTVFCGETPASEPETRALVHLMRQHAIPLLWMFHNAGSDVIGNTHPLSQKLISLFSEKTGFRKLGTADWKRLGQTGTAAEWCDVHNVVYVEIEGSSRWGSDWDVQKNGIQAILREMNATHTGGVE